MKGLPAMGLGPRRTAARAAESLIMAVAVAIGTVAIVISAGIGRDNEKADKRRASSSAMRYIEIYQFQDEKILAVIDEAAFARMNAQARAYGVPESWFKELPGRIPPVTTAFLQYSCAAALRLSAADEWLIPDSTWMDDPGVFALPEVRLAAGRFFTLDEFTAGAPVVVVGANVARRLAGGRDLLGMTVQVRPYSWLTYTYSATIVGITEETAGVDAMRHPADWLALTKVYQDFGPSAVVIVDKPGDVPGVAAAIRALISDGGSELAALRVSTSYEEYLLRRNLTRMLVIASLGISLLTLLIALWTIGSLFSARLPAFRSALSLLRALGARRSAVIATCVSELAPVSLAGIALGAAGAAAARSFVMRRAPLEPGDALVLAAVAALSMILELIQVLPVLSSDSTAAFRR
jgi:hypothetical protein